MIEENPDHENYRLTLTEALEIIIDHKIDDAGFTWKYIYLFAFDRKDRIVFGRVLRPDDPPVALEVIIDWVNLSDINNDNYYFMVKIKEYDEIKFNDNRDKDYNYFEGWIETQGNLARIKTFIESWKDFEAKEGGDNPVLFRYTVEFINEKLDLPFRYSEYQRDLDIKELSKSFPWWQRSLINLFKRR